MSAGNLLIFDEDEQEVSVSCCLCFLGDMVLILVSFCPYWFSSGYVLLLRGASSLSVAKAIARPFLTHHTVLSCPIVCSVLENMHCCSLSPSSEADIKTAC